MGPACREHLVRTCALAGCAAMQVRWEVAPFKERQYRDDRASRWLQTERARRALEQQTVLWVGIDLGSVNHQVCALDAAGEQRLTGQWAHRGEDVNQLIDELVELAGGEASSIAVALETPDSGVVEMFLERGARVFSINPKQLDRFRDRHSVAGAKDDRLDAWVLAHSLRSDPNSYRAVRLGSAELVQLKELSRMLEQLTADDNALCNRIDAELLRSFPEARGLGSVHTDDWMLDLLALGPTPMQARRLALGKVRGVLTRRHVRRCTPEQVVGVLRGPTLRVAPGVAEASGMQIELLVARVRLVREQRRVCRSRIDALLEQLSEPDASEDQPKQHRDAAIVLSLPGVGTVVGAAMLAEAWQPLQERDYRRLRCVCGTAPVTRRSGKTTTVHMRQANNPRLRQAMYHWARCSLQRDGRSKAHYARLRAAGHSHGRALRGLADRLLWMLLQMLHRNELYDPARRALAECA
jgi:transposase